MSNLWYIEKLYRQWELDPFSVSGQWNDYFRETGTSKAGDVRDKAETQEYDMAYRQSRVDSLLWAFRDIGYLYAGLNPLGGDYGPDHSYLHQDYEGVYEKLTLEEFGIPPQDMDTIFSAGRFMKPSPAPLREILKGFRETYCGTIGVEFLHIQDKRIRGWLIERMESTRNRPKLEKKQKRIILEDLLRTEALEKSLHQNFVGQKRFSLEGSEALIPGLHFLVDSAGRFDIREIVIGTTHRGRLAILHTILHMSAEEILSTFEDNYREGLYGGSGDVKYHLGYETDHILEDGGRVRISLAANASHLESIDPIVEGKARAIQDIRYNGARKKVLPVLLHGDAAFSGQGLVAEVFNLSRLAGFTTGGTIHIIINNQIGFTTSSRSARSFWFPTDVAKALSVPIFHINGDDPEAFAYGVNLALEFRQTFSSDCVLDLFCYRRHGHNEADEPSFTQPQMYQLIGELPGVAALYGRYCAETHVAGKEEQAGIREKYADTLKQALEHIRSEPLAQITSNQGPEWDEMEKKDPVQQPETRVEEQILKKIVNHITTVPEGFHVHPTLGRILEKKRAVFEDQGQVDWSLGESLAMGTLLLEGTRVRMSGEDCVRGTFSQRHLTWWDTSSDQPQSYTPLANLDPQQAELMVFDSPLSEYSILGFEYGYSLVSPAVLVMWEAQFGDFANGAQVIIDNYIVSAKSKWNRSSGLVMLLPHGNDGQGPDHSSAHLERFLQLAAYNNIQVCNPTTPAQYFHLLRRQVQRNFRKPLIIMSPKILLRHKKAVSSCAELISGSFQPLLDTDAAPDGVERLLLCSGKIYYELEAQRDVLGRVDTAVIRMEQLYPFPETEIRPCLERYGNVREIIWVQEEPRNAGAWGYMREQFMQYFASQDLRYYGREESDSGATASFREFQQEQKKLIEGAFDSETK